MAGETCPICGGLFVVAGSGRAVVYHCPHCDRDYDEVDLRIARATRAREYAAAYKAGLEAAAAEVATMTDANGVDYDAALEMCDAIRDLPVEANDGKE